MTFFKRFFQGAPIFYVLTSAQKAFDREQNLSLLKCLRRKLFTPQSESKKNFLKSTIVGTEKARESRCFLGVRVKAEGEREKAKKKRKEKATSHGSDTNVSPPKISPASLHLSDFICPML